ncbi:MAG TPA: ArsR family transcriptional regulator [Streptosporangiaceae bacterium]|nr:ArsR family transcriptional regulator [Streptosporangiaceae bacterium]
MGLWLVNADTVATSRFVISPLAETLACLIALLRSTADTPAAQEWLGRHQPAYRAQLASDPVTGLLVRAMIRTGWITDFLTPPPGGTGDADFAAELAVVRRTGPAAARADVAVTLGGGPVPDALDRDDLAPRAADLLDWVWRETVLPYWPRRRRILEAEIVARTAQLSQHGWAATLDDMRPGMRWLGDGRLQINAYDYPPLEISGGRLAFVPVTPRTGWVTWNDRDQYAVIYPCSGVLAEDGPAAVAPAALSALLGPGRATVLAQLGTPMSTTQLVAVTGQGLGSVGRHLKILLDAGLVRRRRSGRSVLYYRTETGEALITAD